MNPMYENRQESFVGFRTDYLAFPPHLHAELEILYVWDGSIEVTIDGHKKSLKQGDMGIIFPNSIHSYDMPSDGAQNSFDIFIVKPLLVGDYSYVLLNTHPLTPFLDAAVLTEDVPYAIRRLLEQAQSNPQLSICKGYLLILLAYVWPRLSLEQNQNADNNDSIYQSVNYVLKNYQQPFTMEHMAKDLGMGKYQLSRIFSDKLHVGFNDYVNQIRIHHAQELLCSTDITITDVAYSCGFDSSRTFNRAFQKFTHVCPHTFRKLNNSS